MTHQASDADIQFVERFEAGRVAPAEFDHRAHLRLAYVYLTRHTVDGAHVAMKDSLIGFLRHVGIEATKYHETITGAWIRAVRHFMELTEPCSSADEFIDRNPKMLDAKTMLTHYSAELLFSDDARARHVEPDLDPIPRYDD